MNEEEMNEQIARMLRKTIKNMSHTNINHLELHCDKDSLDYELKHIHCGTNRCKGLLKKNNIYR